jgi:hypothetical protein
MELDRALFPINSDEIDDAVLIGVGVGGSVSTDCVSFRSNE